MEVVRKVIQSSKRRPRQDQGYGIVVLYTQFHYRASVKWFSVLFKYGRRLL